MATDATGTPTSLGIPKYDTSVDAPSGLGFNAAMDEIDSLLSGIKTSAITVTGTPSDKQQVTWRASAGGAWIPDNVDPTTLKQAGATNGQVLAFNTGTAKWGPATPFTTPVFLRANGVYDLNTSTTESSLISGATATGTTGFKIPANTLGSTGILRLRLLLDFLNNTGGTANPVVKVKFGGTTLFNAGLGNAVSSVTRYGLPMEFVIANLGATNSNFMEGTLSILNSASANTGTTGLFTVLQPTAASSAGATSVDTTADCYFDVTWTHPSSTANLSVRRLAAMVELL